MLSVLLSITCSNSIEPTQLDNADKIKYYTYRIVEEYPHRQDAFTQGLVYTGGFLLESTGLYGQSSLRKVDLETGNIMQRIN